MSEQTELDGGEFPKKGSSGSGACIGYSVEARYAGGKGYVEVAGRTLTADWARLHPDEGAIGIPARNRCEPWLEQSNLMNYPAAQAIRWWFHALAEREFKNLCIQTRIVKHEVKYSYSETAVSEHVIIGDDDRSNIMPDWGEGK